MKSACNLLFIFILMLTFSPLKSLASCDNFNEVVDECHQCHDEHENESKKDSSNQGTHENCEMACCHITFVIINPIFILSSEPQKVVSAYPEINGKDTSDYQNNLFRPPIS
jgi:hypothetical protein